VAAAIAAVRGDLSSDADRLVVIFTDGDLSRTDVDRLERIVADGRARGVHVYAVGIGADADAAGLARVTGSPARVYLTARLADPALTVAALPACR
jgi:hypothetical protein